MPDGNVQMPRPRRLTRLTDMDLVLVVDESGTIVQGRFGGKKLPKSLINGRIIISFGRDDEPEMVCRIVNGEFCCKPPVPGIPVCP